MTLSVAAQAVLARLEQGPASTIELQAACPTTHAPKGIFDCRAAGYVITTDRLPNRVAIYTLRGRMSDVPEETAATPPVAASPRAPVTWKDYPGEWGPAPDHAIPRAPVPEFGDLTLLRQMRTARR